MKVRFQPSAPAQPSLLESVTPNSTDADMPNRIDRLARLSLLLALAVALLGFVLRDSQVAPFWGGLLLAFGEAALVGGLADWFAVRALFVHPFGLPFPHTAIIPRNRLRIVREIRSLVLTVNGCVLLLIAQDPGLRLSPVDQALVLLLERPGAAAGRGAAGPWHRGRARRRRPATPGRASWARGPGGRRGQSAGQVRAAFPADRQPSPGGGTGLELADARPGSPPGPMGRLAAQSDRHPRAARARRRHLPGSRLVQEPDFSGGPGLRRRRSGCGHRLCRVQARDQAILRPSSWAKRASCGRLSAMVSARSNAGCARRSRTILADLSQYVAAISQEHALTGLLGPVSGDASPSGPCGSLENPALASARPRFRRLEPLRRWRRHRCHLAGTRSTVGADAWPRLPGRAASRRDWHALRSRSSSVG